MKSWIIAITNLIEIGKRILYVKVHVFFIKIRVCENQRFFMRLFIQYKSEKVILSYLDTSCSYRIHIIVDNLNFEDIFLKNLRNNFYQYRPWTNRFLWLKKDVGIHHLYVYLNSHNDDTVFGYQKNITITTLPLRLRNMKTKLMFETFRRVRAKFLSKYIIALTVQPQVCPDTKYKFNKIKPLLYSPVNSHKRGFHSKNRIAKP